MTGTDPASFDPEVTGAFQVQPLAEAMQPGYAGDDGGAPPPAQQYAPDPYAGTTGGLAAMHVDRPLFPNPAAPPVSLTYAHSDGRTFTRVDQDNALTHRIGDGSDDEHRERLLLRALLEHTLAMLRGEDVS